MSIVLLIDINNLAHRAFHAMPNDLAHDGVLTSVIYGVLRDIQLYQNHFRADRTAFAFDTGRPARQLMDPSYKSGRAKRRDEATPEERAARGELNRQLELLRDVYLKEIGFANICTSEGFEADDIIASLCTQSINQDDNAIIVSSDHDLYQCLRRNICVFHPSKKELVTEQLFMERYQVNPLNWADVKAIAGCTSDDVAGIKGIGEKYASRYIRGQLPASSAAFKKIMLDRAQTHKRNIILTRLPFPGTPKFELRPDSVTADSWNAFADKMGMATLRINTFKKKDVTAKKPEDLWKHFKEGAPSPFPAYLPDEEDVDVSD